MKCIKLLLFYKANVNDSSLVFKDKGPNSSIYAAMFFCHSKIVNLLLNNGAVFDFNNEMAFTIMDRRPQALNELIKHVAKVDMQSHNDLHRQAKNFNFEKLYLPMQKFYMNCTNELQIMKNTLCWNERTVTYFDLLTDQDITPLTRNESLMTSIETETISDKFPIYRNELIDRINEAKYRQKLINDATKAFSFLVNLNENTCSIILDTIIRHLYVTDLKSLSLA